MSDGFYESEIPFWSDRDDRELAREIAEHDLRDAAHEAFLDRRDRDLPMRTVILDERRDEGSADGSYSAGTGRRSGSTPASPADPALSVPSSGLCPACRDNSSVPGGDLCSDCLSDILAGTDA